MREEDPAPTDGEKIDLSPAPIQIVPDKIDRGFFMSDFHLKRTLYGNLIVIRPVTQVWSTANDQIPEGLSVRWRFNTFGDGLFIEYFTAFLKIKK